MMPFNRTALARHLGCAIAVLLVLTGCTSSDQPPQLPSSTDHAALSSVVLSANGANFLRDITGHAWDDGGREAGDLFAWIPRDAQSQDQAVAVRAGETAHAIASFLTDERESLTDAPANPELWQSFSAALVPYLGAAVGNGSDVAGFAPLDDLQSSMTRTVGLFLAMTKDTQASRALVNDATSRAASDEEAFADAVTTDPTPATIAAEAERTLLPAARLRSVIATSAHVADPDSEQPSSAPAQTRVAFEVASRTARVGDPTIDPKFFGSNGRLLPPDQIPSKDWSVYDSQLSVYLASPPAVNEAISRFGRVYQRIVGQA